MKYPASVVEKKIASIRVELRQDGAHLFWEYVEESDVPSKRTWWKHEIILKDVLGPELTRAHMLRVHAFCATITEEEGDKAKLNQKQWERALDVDKLPLPSHDHFKRAVSRVVESVAREFKTRKDNEIKGARSSLRYSVIEALEHFTPDEVETIIRESIAESVMKE